MEYRPNPQPLPRKGRGAKFKASLLLGERFGERSKLYCTQGRTAIKYTGIATLTLNKQFFRGQV
jgi:hypothetical protein